MPWDSHLLERFRAGEQPALEEVFRTHAEPLARSLRSAAFQGRGFERLRAPSELENMVLEVFSRAFEPRARSAYDGERPYGAYLMGIARIVMLERSRERELAVGLSPEEEASGGAPPEGDLAQAVEDREVEGLLREFLEGRPSEEQRLYALRFVEELPQERAAESLGLTRIQVRRREFALKRELLHFLQRRGYLKGLVARGWSFLRRTEGS
ncbi:sigma-70 family RNA polymerase sigma factor [Aggregicoccus sp. 17bor-14]|uniref:RNA polymerase sigma factor n=1 Tax=Myxococcaceae TaxID=31 RepID=UPI00129CFCC9|nr:MULTISPECIES: sigma-70 family RNA polymerase sigma factor [Myxococcaceae]MBF5042334.1 sigma-70 family RNA polymerase sigma factor [Simulacricoccus sp. 17bor-14]MRI88107.1 sigma-70 family RNA polymerase sigma factor [Aggregicoccus sp. 17bor-14]